MSTVLESVREDPPPTVLGRHRARPPVGRRRLEAPRRPEAGAATRRAGRRPDRRLPSWRDRTPRHRSRRLSGPPAEADLRAHDRLGPDGPLCPGRRAGHQLRRPLGDPVHDRPGWRAAGASAEPDRGFRRGRPASGLRHRVRPARGGPVRPGAGGRRGHGRRSSAARRDDARTASGRRLGERGTNLLDSGAWFYDVYETADGGYISLGPLDAQSFHEMVRITGLADDVDGGGPLPEQSDKATWPPMKRRMATLIKTRTRDEWCSLLEGTDACFAPVLDPGEAPLHPQNRSRGTFTDIEGVVQPAPAPRFSRTAPRVAGPPPAAGPTHRRGSFGLGNLGRGDR